MAYGVDLQVSGVDSMQQKLRKIAQLGAVKDVVLLNGLEMQKTAMVFAPVDTGFLKREIRLYIEDSGYTARMASEAEYAIFQELGTRYQSGTPHVRPAFRKQEEKFLQDVRRAVNGSWE